jgi:hypothetical protein
MNDIWTLEKIEGLILSSRLKLGEMGYIIRSLMATNPDAVRIFVPRLRALQTRQVEIEKKLAEIDFDQNNTSLGFVWLIVGAAGAALSALGLWTWKHHEEVSFERLQLETFQKCIDEKVKAGIAREEAEYTCSRLYSDEQKGAISDLEGLIKTAAIATAGLLGIYLIIKMKK